MTKCDKLVGQRIDREKWITKCDRGYKEQEITSEVVEICYHIDIVQMRVPPYINIVAGK